MKEQAKKYRIKTTNVELWVKTAPKEVQAPIRWLHNYGRVNNLSPAEIGAKLKQPSGSHYSGDSVYQLLIGRRSIEQMGNMLKAITDLEKIERERASITRAGFVETNLTKKIFKICDSARNFCKIMFIIGPSHIGKTTALREYARRNNSGKTIYLRAPAGGGKARTLQMLSESLNLPMYGSVTKREMNLLENIDDTQVIIIDEAHQFLHGTLGTKTLEFLRELHDVTGCGMVFSATEVFADAMEGGDAAMWLRQMQQRHLINAHLPKKPTKANLADFSAHFGLPPAKDQALDLQTEIIRHDSLGRWVSILEGASRIASKQGQPITWEHVLQCHAALLDLENL